MNKEISSEFDESKVKLILVPDTGDLDKEITNFILR